MVTGNGSLYTGHLVFLLVFFRFGNRLMLLLSRMSSIVEAVRCCRLSTVIFVQMDGFSLTLYVCFGDSWLSLTMDAICMVVRNGA